jgi:chromate transporter
MAAPAPAQAAPPTTLTEPSLGEATRVWLKIGLLGFGGPGAQIALMHRLLVDEHRWIGEAQFLHALNFCMLLPGPEAQQLATYVGWLLHGTRGGVIAGTLFVLLGLIVILALSAIYAAFQAVPLVEALFFGIKAAALALVVEALLRIGRRILKGRGAFAIAAAACLLLWWLPVAMAALVFRVDDVLVTIGLFFSKLAVVTFGGAYAVLAYMAQAAVEAYGWLRPGEMLDGLGLAETTPGPLILVTTFVGFLAAFRDPGGLPPMLAGGMGALLTTWVTFLPCFLWIFLGAPFIERLRQQRSLAAALAAITAAVVGVIANLALWFALHYWFKHFDAFSLGPVRLKLPDLRSLDPAALLLSVIAMVALLRHKLGLFPVLLGSAVLGGVYKLAL